MFNEVVEKLGGKFQNIYYATNNPDKENNEYMVIDPDTKKKYFLDFFIQETKKCLEFDGDYWHGERRGNQERDRLREENLVKLGYKIFRVKERDYKANPEKIVLDCVNFLVS